MVTLKSKLLISPVLVILTLCSINVCSTLTLPKERPSQDSTRHGSRNKTTSLTVVKKDDCGTPKENRFTECVHPNSFPNCSSFAPPASVQDIHINQKLVENESKLILEVKWKIPKAGNSDIWGWQVMVVDMKVDPNSQMCLQVNEQYTRSNNGDRYVSLTFPKKFHFGTLINVTIQSLPAMDMKLVYKTVETKDYCDFFRNSPCCYVVKNISFEQRDQNSVIVTWPGIGDVNNSKNLTAYYIYYESYPNDLCHHDHITSPINNTYVLINDLRSTCQNYTIRVSPKFNTYLCDRCQPHTCESYSRKGLISKDFKFQLNTMLPVSSDAKRGQNPLTNLIKALIVVAGVLSFCAVILIFVVVRNRKRARQAKKEPNKIEKKKSAIEVFIAHSSHCGECKDIAVAVATYLNLTGRCNSFVDLCSLPKEWSSGTTQYYENEIMKREKVIILCTINDDEKGDQENPEVRNFIYQMNLIRSEILANCTTTKFIPVYMDFSSDLDLPCFLRNKKSFSLPSQLRELLLYIIEQPLCKPVSVSPIVSLEEDNNLVEQKRILEAKIRELKIKHHKKLKNKNNNFITKV